MEITKVKDVWIVETNTDLTEGRGYNYPIHVCESEATAIRLSKRKYIQGSDAPIHKGIAVCIDGGSWLAPCNIEVSTNEDDRNQQLIDARKQAIQKAKSAGLTDDDIALIASKK